MNNELLTPLELKVMHLLWELERAFVRDLLEKWPEKEIPAYNTVSTIVRILEEKGFVSHEAFGRSHQYYALMSKGEYQQRFLKNAVENVFSGSLSGMISRLVEQPGQLSAAELEKLRQLIDETDDV
jgi:BlaI family transcriptional regulator, penicillinase repressor